MSKILKSLVWVSVCGCVLCGCETVERALNAQEAIAAYTNDVVVAKGGTNRVAQVNLAGCDLYEYVAYAMTNRPSLEVSRLAVSNATLTLMSVTADRELQLSLSGGFSQATMNSGSHFSWRQKRGRGTTDISADLLICDFGRTDARELEARENLVAAQRNLADQEYAVFDEVAQAYFNLLKSDALLDVARTNEYMYAEHLKQSELLFSSGEAKKLDVLKARVDLSDARLATINASNEVVTAGAEFIRSLGLESDRATRTDVLPVSDSALNVITNVLPLTTYSAVEGLQLARTNAPSLMVLRAKLRASRARVDYAIADLLPELTLSSAFSFADPTWNWSWGFRAIQSGLDGFRKQTAVDSAVVDMESARAAVEEAEQQLSYDLSVAAAVRDNARQSLETAKIEVEQAKENFDNVMMQYRVGDASRLDFTDAAGSLANALGARVKAFYAAEAAEAKLIRLSGRAPVYDRVSHTTGTLREVSDEEMD